MKISLKKPESELQETEKDLMKSVDFMKWMGISRQTMYRLIQCENLPCKKIGHTFYFYKPDVLEWIRSK